jgi:serine/threonine-protein kinase
MFVLKRRAAAVTAIRLRAGTTLGRYEVARCLGQGATGIVYEAVHRSLGRRVALKVLHAPPPVGEHSERAEQRFLREGRVAAQVRHPHVVDVYDCGVEDGLPFLVMELVEGESLAQRLRREAKLPVERAVEVLLPVLSAVAELHAAGIVHRDIKPANILLARGGGGCPKLADFGVSRFDDGSPSITKSGAIIGTPEYMAPELMREKTPATEQSDQYALGVSLYECTTGHKPFSGATDYELMHAVVSAELAPPSSREPTLSTAFDQVVLRAMDRDPERRFASLDEFAEALLPFASEDVSARWRSEFQAPEATRGRTASASRRDARGASSATGGWRRRAAGLGAIVAMVGALATLAMGGRGGRVPVSASVNTAGLKPFPPTSAGPVDEVDESARPAERRNSDEPSGNETLPSASHNHVRSWPPSISPHAKTSVPAAAVATANKAAAPGATVPRPHPSGTVLTSDQARGENQAPILDVP